MKHVKFENCRDVLFSSSLNILQVSQQWVNIIIINHVYCACYQKNTGALQVLVNTN